AGRRPSSPRGPPPPPPPRAAPLRRPRQESVAAGVALDLATGGPGHASGAEQHNGERIYLMLLLDRPPHRARDRGHVRGLALAQFAGDDQSFLAIALHGERRAATGLEGGVGLLRGALDVL